MVEHAAFSLDTGDSWRYQSASGIAVTVELLAESGDPSSVLPPLDIYSFLNIAPYMGVHWRGNFFRWERAAGASKAKFRSSGEDYCIRPELWKKIDEDIKQMVHPTALGNTIRGVGEFRKVNEWKTWTNVLSPILLKERLPEPFYSEWVNLVEARTLATDYSVNKEDIGTIRQLMMQFVVHYHDKYYRCENNRLSACKPVFHAILRIADVTEWSGPMWSYAQWVMEHMFAIWVPKVYRTSNVTVK